MDFIVRIDVSGFRLKSRNKDSYANISMQCDKKTTQLNLERISNFQVIKRTRRNSY